jgi:hypothetical protein
MRRTLAILIALCRSRDVAQPVPTHGRVGTGDKLLKMFAKGMN